MPMIDVYAAQGTAGFVHELPAGSLSNVDGDSDYVRVQVKQAAQGEKAQGEDQPLPHGPGPAAGAGRR